MTKNEELDAYEASVRDCMMALPKGYDRFAILLADRPRLVIAGPGVPIMFCDDERNWKQLHPRSDA